jgi:hypothetical protein
VVRAFLDRHTEGKQPLVKDLLQVWAAEVPDESLKKEAQTIVALLSRRIHIPFQSKDFKLQREALLPIDSASGGDRARADEVPYQEPSGTEARPQYTVATGVMCIPPLFKN